MRWRKTVDAVEYFAFHGQGVPRVFYKKSKALEHIK